MQNSKLRQMDFQMRIVFLQVDFGPTFRAQLENKLKIIVKQLKNTSQGQKSFDSEVHVLSRARHANVVMLLGSCVEEVTCCSYMSMHAMVLLTNIYQVSKSFFFFFNKVFSKLVWRKVPQTHYVGTQNIIHEHFQSHDLLIQSCDLFK